MSTQGLTDRKVQILQMLADGYTPKEIAAQFGIMKRTVRKHLVECKKTLGATSHVQMIARAVALGHVHVSIEHNITSEVK